MRSPVTQTEGEQQDQTERRHDGMPSDDEPNGSRSKRGRVPVEEKGGGGEENRHDPQDLSGDGRLEETQEVGVGQNRPDRLREDQPSERGPQATPRRMTSLLLVFRQQPNDLPEKKLMLASTPPNCQPGKQGEGPVPRNSRAWRDRSPFAYLRLEHETEGRLVNNKEEEIWEAQ